MTKYAKLMYSLAIQYTKYSLELAIQSVRKPEDLETRQQIFQTNKANETYQIYNISHTLVSYLFN